MNEDNKDRWKIIKPVISTEEIIDDLKKKLKLESENNAYLKQLAILLYKQKRYEESFEYLEKLLASGVRDPEILSSYGHILLIRGRYREAKTYFKETLDKNDDDSIAREGMLEIEKIEERTGRVKKKIIKYAVIVTLVVIFLMIVSIVFTKNLFSFLTPNKLYQGIVDYYNKEMSGIVKITSAPSGANIFIDNKRVDIKTPAEIALIQGTHIIKVVKDGYVNSEKTIKVVRKSYQNISFSLEKSPGILSVKSNPNGAKIYINGDYKGITPIELNLKEGKYNLTISMENYENFTTEVVVFSGQIKYINAQLVSILGKLIINSNPTSANVYINGNYKGITPLTLSLPSGNYKIELKKEGYDDYVLTTNVYNYKTTNLTLTLKKGGKYKFENMDYVIASDVVNCREKPSLKGFVLKTIKKGNMGIIQSGDSIYVDGYYWWLVKWVDYNPPIIGWSVGNYIEPWPYIGIVCRTMTEQIAQYYNIQFIKGVFVEQVAENSPAYKAGIQPHDIIVTFNGINIQNEWDLNTELASKKPGDTVEINVVRSNNIIKFLIVLGVHPHD